MERSDSWEKPMPSTVRSLGGDDAPLAYHDGVHAIVEIAGRFSGDDWNAQTHARNGGLRIWPAICAA